MSYKHLVLSGGSWKGLYIPGAIDTLINKEIIKIEYIESIWGTSVGTLIGTLLALKLEWSSVIKYFLNVPIKDFDNLNLDNYVSMFNDCGVLDKQFFIKLLGSFFKSKYLDINTLTLKEFFDYSNIDQHFFAISFQTMETIDFNHITHPNMKLLDALYCSCSFPFLFKPQTIENIVYLDGGLNVHYPSARALEKHNNEEIFGIYIKTDDTNDNNMKHMLDFGLNLIYKLIFTKQMVNLEKLNNQLIIVCECKMANDILELLKNKKLREVFINKGKDAADKYLNNSIQELGK